MYLNSVKLINFRNHKKKTFTFSNKTLLTGNNGAGKTNVLEAIYLTLNPGKKSTPERNIMFENKEAMAELEFSKNGSVVTADIVFREDGKTYRENKKPANKKTIPLKTIYFRPEDSQIISGGPSKRRGFLDEISGQTDALYLNELYNYNRALKQKNYLLRISAPQQQIEPWNNKITELGAQLYLKRERTTKELLDKAKELFLELGEGEIETEYASQAEGKDPRGELENKIAQKTQEERERKNALVGIHLDELKICVNKINITSYGSHGQQRTAVFILRIAQAKLLKERWKENPLILLDDLKSELDSSHKEAVEKILNSKNQIIATATDKCFNEKEFSCIEI